MNWILALIALANVACAILAWVAKIRWSNEYKAVVKQTIDTKDDAIKAKEAHIEHLRNEIENLKQMTPMKIREYFLSVKEQFEEYNEDLKSKIKLKDKEIDELQASGDVKNQKLKKAEQEKKQLVEKLKIYGETSTAMDTTIKTLKTITATAALAGKITLRKRLEDGSYVTADEWEKMKKKKEGGD